MRIDFKIYWFENDKEYIDSKKIEFENLVSFLRNKGFMPEIIFFLDSGIEESNRFLVEIRDWKESFKINSIQDYDPNNLTEIDFSDADIVLMDFNLSAENTWDTIISHIRDNDNHFYTEVLFYSSVASPSNFWEHLKRTENKTEAYLRHLANRDGIYCSHRDELFSKSERVIQTIIRKTQDLNNLRWLVMAETADIDEIMRKILLKICTKFSSMIAICNVPPCRSCGHRKKTTIQLNGTNLLETSDRSSTWQELVNSDSTTRANLYNAILVFLGLSLNSTSLLSTSIPIYRTFDDDTCRNILAHQPEEWSTRILMQIRKTDGTLESFDEARFNSIRQKIRDYKKIFLQLESELT